MKKLILMSGVPGSGKSTWANKYKTNTLMKKAKFGAYSYLELMIMQSFIMM